MDDKFLYQLREQLDPEFAESLHKKLNQDQSPSKWSLHMNFQLSSLGRKTKLAWATTLIALILVTTAISPARAWVSALVAHIAGQAFEVTTIYPGGGKVETIPAPQQMSLAEALSIFPHEITLPSALPPGFTMDEEYVSVYLGEQAGPFADTMIIQWQSQTGAYMTLHISNHDWSEQAEIIAPEVMEELLLDGEQVAVLIKGGWDADMQEWQDMGILRLRWQVADLAYDLHGNTEYITVEQLIQIARSTLK